MTATENTTQDKESPVDKSDPDYVRIFDTTLRDGEQSPGCSMNLEEKVRVALILEELGVDIIEAGFPIASNGDFEAVREALTEAGFEAETADVTFVPDNTVTLSGDAVDQFMRLIDLLDDCDDVQNVHHNADISDEDAARLSG